MAMLKDFQIKYYDKKPIRHRLCIRLCLYFVTKVEKYLGQNANCQQ